MRATEPVHRTFLLHPDIDIEAAKDAYETQGWIRDGDGSLCTIDGVRYRLLGFKRLGRIVNRDWRRDPKQPYDVPPGWDVPQTQRR
ncbi:hypothetical protein [Phycicoccus sp. 3266]|uniref:hypothetical protein n=1 Tax=Phycicoccus sp. 3266 TaxID=2817751 RepID=UPI00285FE5B6|nr:hypothetical protein [Phycicoccus sp. 3266]MDR6862166.1 hypothetical protein [Phycicoccus sp. 3266]